MAKRTEFDLVVTGEAAERIGIQAIAHAYQLFGASCIPRIEVVCSWMDDEDDPAWDKGRAGNFNDEPYVLLRFRCDIEHDDRTTTWLLLHELRHAQQFYDPVLWSATHPRQMKTLYDFFGGEDTYEVAAALHEIDPAEVDANVFACTALDMKLRRNQRFSLTKTMLAGFLRG